MERMEQGLLTMASHLHHYYSAPLLRKQPNRLSTKSCRAADCKQTKYRTNLILCSNISKENLCPPHALNISIAPRCIACGMISVGKAAVAAVMIDNNYNSSPNVECDPNILIVGGTYWKCKCVIISAAKQTTIQIVDDNQSSLASWFSVPQAEYKHESRIKFHPHRIYYDSHATT